VINKAQTDPREFFRGVRSASLRKFDPRAIRYTASHTLDLFNEVATIARPPFEPGYPASAAAKRAQPPSPSTGYIISFYKVFEGDDGERFEKNWLYWTGETLQSPTCPTVKTNPCPKPVMGMKVKQGESVILFQ